MPHWGIFANHKMRDSCEEITTHKYYAIHSHRFNNNNEIHDEPHLNKTEFFYKNGFCPISGYSFVHTTQHIHTTENTSPPVALYSTLYNCVNEIEIFGISFFAYAYAYDDVLFQTVIVCFFVQWFSLLLLDTGCWWPPFMAQTRCVFFFYFLY